MQANVPKFSENRSGILRAYKTLSSPRYMRKSYFVSNDYTVHFTRFIRQKYYVVKCRKMLIVIHNSQLRIISQTKINTYVNYFFYTLQRKNVIIEQEMTTCNYVKQSIQH